MTGSDLARIVCGVVIALAPSVALADGSETALAQSLFDEGVRLMEQNRYAEACPKLAESQRLDPGGGTLLNLGLCREKEGKLATAWAIYNEALSQAIKDGRKEREATARQRVEELGPMLAKIVIRVPSDVASLGGLVVTLDGVDIGRAAFGVESPIDAGDHVMTAKADGKLEWQQTISVKKDGETSSVDVPMLADAPPPVVEKPVYKSNPLRPIGFVIGGVGVAGIAVGAIAGGLAIGKRGESNAECPMNQCSAKGVALNEDAKSMAWVSNIGIGVGIAALITGTIFIIAGKPTLVQRAMLVPSPNGAGAFIRF